MRHLLALIFVLFSQFLVSQGFKVRYWAPLAVNNYAKFIFETSPGNYLTGGLVVDTLNGKQINKIAITGLDQDGQVLWIKKYGDKNLEYLYNPYIRRSFYRLGNFFYHACGVRDAAGNAKGAFIKFNLTGDTLWQKVYSDPDGMVPQMVTGSVDGGFLITGYCVTGIPTLLIKTDRNGNELWRRKLTGADQDGRAILQDTASKKIVIAGIQSGGLNPVDNLMVLDSLGTKIHHLAYNLIGGLFADMIQTKDKKIVAVGIKYCPEKVAWDNLNQAFAVKFDLNSPFAPIWKIDGFGPKALRNSFNCIYELNNEDIIIGGDLDTLWHKDLTIRNYHRLTRIDKNGKVKWNTIYDYCIDTSKFHLQSLTSITPGFNGGILASFQLYNTSPNPFFFVKYDSTGCDSTLEYCRNVLGINVFSAQKDLKFLFYPNPANDMLYLQTEYIENAELSLTDISGREVKRLKLEQMQSINIRDLKSGIYFISVDQNKKTLYTTKLIKE